MDAQTLQSIYNRVLILTQRKSLVWKQSGSEEYEASFSRSSLKICSGAGADFNAFVLEVYNEDGIVIGYVSSSDRFDDYAEAALHLELNVEPLYRLVEDQVYKFEDTSRSLMEDLNKLEQSAGFSILSAKYVGVISFLMLQKF